MTSIYDAVRLASDLYPYFRPAINGLRLVADRRVPTMATSAAWVTHYNPDTLDTWTEAEAAAVLVHEVQHLLRHHHARCADRDPQTFNVAGDAEINQHINGLPDGAVYPASFGAPNGHTAETYYGILGARKQPEDDTDGDQSGDQSGDGDAGEDGTGSGESGQPGNACGSAAGGPTQPHERDDADHPGTGADDPAAIERETAEAIMAASAPGIVAGVGAGAELRAWAETVISLDRSAWYTALATALGRALAPTSAPTRWTWPGRRDMRDMGGAMLPRWTGTRPTAAVIIDTSSSIKPDDIAMAVAAGRLLARIADVTYWACDDTPRRLGREMPDRLPGGGGTNLTRGIDAAIRDGARAVVLITDCVTPWPHDATPVPLIVGANVYASTHVIPAGAAEHDWAPPEWATVIPVIDN